MAGERRLPGLGLYGFWTAGTRGWKAGNDENLLRLSALVQGAAVSRTVAVPASPADGSVYIVPSGANGGKIAVRDAGAWTYLDPRAGTRMYVADTGTFAYHDGTAWKDEDAGEVFSFLGLADTPNAYGAPGQVLSINPNGDGIAFIDPPEGGGGGGGTELPAFTNNAGKVLAVKSDASGVEWVTPATGVGGTKKFKHWRMRSVTPGAGGYFGMSEIEFRIGGAKQAGTPFSLLQYDTSYPPSNAYDGVNGTFYFSSDNTVGNYIGVSFSSPLTIEEFRAVAADNRNNYMPTGFVIEAANGPDPKAASYTEVLAVTGQDWGSASNAAKTYTLPPIAGPADPPIAEAPQDGKGYVRKNGGWAEESTAGTTPPGTAGKHRYWRAVFTAPNPSGGDPTYVAIGEFQWRDAVGGVQKAVAGTPLSSGAYASDRTAIKAYDGTPSTYWESQVGSMAAGTLWLGYDFGSPIGIAEVLVQKSTQYPAENPYEIAIQFSDDNTTWVTARTFNTGFTATDSGKSMTAIMPGYAPPPVYVETDTSVLAMAAITQAQYDALTTKVATTVYLVKTTAGTFKLYLGLIPLAV